jgi:hypothetical protein
VLGRRARRQDRERLGPAGHVQRQLVAVAGRDPQPPAAGRHADVVGEEGRHQPAAGPRAARVGHVDHRYGGRLCSQRHPHGPAVGRDRQVAHERPDLAAAGEAAAFEVDDHDFAARRVGHVGVTPVRGHHGVARLGHSAQHAPHPHR